MADLPEGWTQLMGVSCAGWDIWAGTTPHRPEGSRFAIFKRRIGESDTYTMGKTHATLTSVQEAIKDIRRAFDVGEYRAEMLFPMEDNPEFGRF